LRGYAENNAAGLRIEGYRAAMSAAGLELDERLITGNSFQFQGAFDAMQALLATGVTFTGVVAPSDHAALGAIQALSAAGRRVPEDISVIGCANIDTAAMSNPPLTTVDQKPEELGTLAMRELIRRIEDPDSAFTAMTVNAALVLRQSTAPAP
jgi:LacI family transcriptional regulator